MADQRAQQVGNDEPDESDAAADRDRGADRERDAEHHTQLHAAHVEAEARRRLLAERERV